MPGIGRGTQMDVIDFLEQMGRCAGLRHAGREGVGHAPETDGPHARPSTATPRGDEVRLRAVPGQVTFMSVQLQAGEEEGGLYEELPAREDDGPAAPVDLALH